MAAAVEEIDREVKRSEDVVAVSDGIMTMTIDEAAGKKLTNRCFGSSCYMRKKNMREMKCKMKLCKAARVVTDCGSCEKSVSEVGRPFFWCQSKKRIRLR